MLPAQRCDNKLTARLPTPPSRPGDQDRTRPGGQAILFEVAQCQRDRHPCRKHKGLLAIQFASKGEKHLTWDTRILAIAAIPGNAQRAAKVRGQHFVP